MAAGFPVKANYATGDVLTATNMNDLAGTLNYLDPTAKGDLFPASDASTLTRLAVGSNDTVLVADSAQTTGLKYSGSWTSYTPTFTNLTVGNGTVACKYFQIGKLVFVEFSFTMGSTSSMGSSPYFTLPITSDNNNMGFMAVNYIEDAGIAGYAGGFTWRDNTTVNLTKLAISGSYFNPTSNITATSPFTWGTGDFIRGIFTYGAA